MAISGEFLQLKDKDKMWHLNQSQHNPKAVCVHVMCVSVCVCVDLKTKVLLQRRVKE